MLTVTPPSHKLFVHYTRLKESWFRYGVGNVWLLVPEALYRLNDVMMYQPQKGSSDMGACPLRRRNRKEFYLRLELCLINNRRTGCQWEVEDPGDIPSSTTR